MLVTSVGNDWLVQFAADPRNCELVVITECKGKVPFQAYYSIPLNDTQTQALARKQQTPAGERCTVEASVMRYTDEDHEFTGESVIIIQEDAR